MGQRLSNGRILVYRRADSHDPILLREKGPRRALDQLYYSCHHPAIVLLRKELFGD